MWILFSRSIDTVITLPSSASARFRTVTKNTVRAPRAYRGASVPRRAAIRQYVVSVGQIQKDERPIRSYRRRFVSPVFSPNLRQGNAARCVPLLFPRTDPFAAGSMRRSLGGRVVGNTKGIAPVAKAGARCKTTNDWTAGQSSRGGEWPTLDNLCAIIRRRETRQKGRLMVLDIYTNKQQTKTKQITKVLPFSRSRRRFSDSLSVKRWP